MKHCLFVISLFWTGCGEKASGLPFGGSGSSSDDTAANSVDADEGGGDPICEDEWNHGEDGISTQPESCLAWSPISMEPMTWYDAASLDEGEAGGCSADDCPPDNEGHCATLAGLGGRNDWRLPTKDELMDAATSAPNIPDVDGRLWSRDSADNATGNAWTVDLSRAGSWMSLGKDDDGIWVRCVATN